MEESTREIIQSKTLLQPKEMIEAMLERQQEQIIALAKIVDLLTKSQDANLQKKWITANAGETIVAPFPGAKTLYVDNTLNSVNMRLRLDGEPGVHLVPAYSAVFIPCDGFRTLSLEGTGFCQVLVTNTPTPPTSVNANFATNVVTTSQLEGFGATIADRPLANAVPIGYIYVAVQTQDAWQSDGVNWVVV